MGACGVLLCRSCVCHAYGLRRLNFDDGLSFTYTGLDHHSIFELLYFSVENPQSQSGAGGYGFKPLV